MTETTIYMKPKQNMSIASIPAITLNENSAVEWNVTQDIAASNDNDKNKIRGGRLTIRGTPIRRWRIKINNNDLDKNIVTIFCC